MIASVVIPAHDEERVLERHLRRLLAGLVPGDLDVVVVCNGCTDDTADSARRVPGVRVLEIAEASKTAAVAAGNASTDVFPRVHLDADVELWGPDLLELLRPLHEDGLLATAPRRTLVLEQSAWPVRWFYAVWEQLPQVRSGLFGRGVVVLSEEGQARVSALPRLMSDDLGMSEVFAASERRVVEEAEVRVVAPATVAALVRRRTRVATGNAQADEIGARRPASITTPLTLLRLARRPSTALRLPVFVAIGLVAHLSSRRAVRAGDFTTWLRDETSRA